MIVLHHLANALFEIGGRDDPKIGVAVQSLLDDSAVRRLRDDVEVVESRRSRSTLSITTLLFHPDPYCGIYQAEWTVPDGGSIQLTPMMGVISSTTEFNPKWSETDWLRAKVSAEESLSGMCTPKTRGSTDRADTQGRRHRTIDSTGEGDDESATAKACESVLRIASRDFAYGRCAIQLQAVAGQVSGASHECVSAQRKIDLGVGSSLDQLSLGDLSRFVVLGQGRRQIRPALGS